MVTSELPGRPVIHILQYTAVRGEGSAPEKGQRAQDTYFVGWRLNHWTIIHTFNMPTSYQSWVWEIGALINWSMVTCQGRTRSELP